jgi:hypothetical protein
MEIYSSSLDKNIYKKNPEFALNNTRKKLKNPNSIIYGQCGGSKLGSKKYC